MNRSQIWKSLGSGLLAAASVVLAGPVETGIRIERLPDGTRYGIIGGKPERPAPLIVMLQGGLEGALAEPLYTATARLLVRQGYVAVVLDAPAHSEDARAGEGAELAAWCRRLDAGEDLLGALQERVGRLLDWLVREGHADPRRLAVAGTSRGGFLAFHVAAADPRFRCAGAISPVTDLRRLREFDASVRPERAAELAIDRLVTRLAGRPVWISIGNQDERVGTDSVIACSRRLVEAAAGEAPVELHVHAVPGHRSTIRDHELLAAWIAAQLAAP
jgi:dienelactone hydrolase